MPQKDGVCWSLNAAEGRYEGDGASGERCGFIRRCSAWSEIKQHVTVNVLERCLAFFLAFFSTLALWC